MVRAFIDVFPQSRAAVGNTSRTVARRHERRPHRDRSGARGPRARSGPRCRGGPSAPRSGQRDGNRRDVRRFGRNAGPCHSRIAAGVGRPSASGIRRALRHRLGNERRARVDLRPGRGRELVSTVLRRGTRRRRSSRGWTRTSHSSTSAYHAPGTDGTARGPYGERRILGSAYLGAVVPDTDAVHNVIGVTLLRQGRYDDAAAAFREALKRRADSVDANRNLGTALAASGHVAESIGYLRRAVQLAPGNGGAQYELGTLLLEQRRFAEAADCLRAAVSVMPDSAGGAQRPWNRAGVAGRPERGHRALQASRGARPGVRRGPPQSRVRVEGAAAMSVLTAPRAPW